MNSITIMYDHAYLSSPLHFLELGSVMHFACYLFDAGFGQHASTDSGSFTGENLSPRSRRLMSLLPKPKNMQDVILCNLNRIQMQVATEMGKIEHVQAVSSSFIREYFARIPPEKVFLIFYSVLRGLCSAQHNSLFRV
jgi:hypothetical protein